MTYNKRSKHKLFSFPHAWRISGHFSTRMTASNTKRKILHYGILPLLTFSNFRNTKHLFFNLQVVQSQLSLYLWVWTLFMREWPMADQVGISNSSFRQILKPSMWILKNIVKVKTLTYKYQNHKSIRFFLIL